jgi:hypothetical protein
MNAQNNDTDRELRQLIQKSKLQMPFSDFEARLMDRIRTEASKDKYIATNIRLSWLFFGLGSMFGLLCATMLVNSDAVILGLNVSKLTIPFYIIGGVVFFLQVEQLLKFTLKNRKGNLSFLKR